MSFSAARASSRCSVETYLSPSVPASRSAARITAISSEPGDDGAGEPSARTGSASNPSSTWARTAAGSTPSLLRIGSTTPPGESARGD